MRIGVVFLSLVIAAWAAALAVAAAPITTRTITYGGTVTFTGKSPVNFKVQSANVLSRPCQITQFSGIGTPPIAADGTFRFKTGPTLNTLYRVLVADRDVLNVNVLVKPAITIQRGNGSMFHVEVTTGNGAGLNGKKVALQQQSGKKWRTVGAVKLKLISGAGAIDAVAAGDGRAALRGTGAVRAFLPSAQAKPCFTASASAPLR